MEGWRKFLKEGALSKNLTNIMHDKWRQGFIADKGEETPRQKPVPLESAEPAESARERLAGEGYEKLEIIDGVLQQDINQPSDKIVPALAHKLNGAPAVDYAKVVETTEINTADDIKKLASEFHEVWMIHNQWQEEGSPELFVSYEQLPSEPINEKLKDLEQLKIALELHYNNPEIMELFNQVYEQTK